MKVSSIAHRFVCLLLICLLLTFGPADAFLPAAQKEDILEAGDLSEDELSDGKTAAAEKAVGTKDREEEEELSDGGPEYQDKKKASLFPRKGKRRFLQDVFRQIFRSLPIKQQASVPGPQCAPITGPMI